MSTTLPDSWRMGPHTHCLSSQLLLTNKLIHAEALPVLYSTNTFDCTLREGVMLLSVSIPAQNFSLITSLVIDWDQLMDFSFQLAKPSFVALTGNLTTLTMAHWRTRVLGGSSFLWRDVKSFERTLMQSALAICEKSAKLGFVTQHHWVSKSAQPQKRRPPTQSWHLPPIAWAKLERERENQRTESGPSNGDTSRTSSTSRIKWRFLASESQMWPNETQMDLEAELALLNTSASGDADEGSVQSALDPF